MGTSSRATLPYDLGALPFERPVMLANAAELVELDPDAAAWCRAHGLEVGDVVEAAVAAGAVPSVQGSVPGKGLRTFIDGSALSDQVSAFLGQVRIGARSIPAPPSRGRLRPWVRRALGQPRV